MRCKTIIEIVTEAMRIVSDDRRLCPYEANAEYFFRGELLNFNLKLKCGK